MKTGIEIGESFYVPFVVGIRKITFIGIDNKNKNYRILRFEKEGTKGHESPVHKWKLNAYLKIAVDTMEEAIAIRNKYLSNI